MWRTAGVGLLTVAACGRFSFERTRGDASDDGALPTGDAAIDAPPCTFGPWTGPFAVPELATSLNEGDPAIRFDGLEIMFSREDPTTGDDIWIARRASTSLPFDPPHALTAVNTSAIDNGCSYSPDGLTLYFKSESMGIKLWTATRSALDQDFGAPAPLAGGPYTEMTDPSVSADGLELFNGDTFGNLYEVTRASTSDDFSQPQPLPAPIATANWHEGPMISRDDRTLFYVELLSAFEIRVATRPARGQPFGTPVSFPELAGGGPEFDPELSADGRELYFVQFDSGESNIYKFQRSCL